MLIDKIETIRIPEHPNLIWVKIYNNDGLFGLGETWFGAEAVEADIHSRLAPLLLGQNPTQIEYIYSKMRPYIGFFGTGVEMRALSALDVALWDLNGKIKNTPLYDLLGGKTKSSIKVYNTCAGPSYVSQNADVRPDNFGTDKSNNKKIQLYEDLEMFMNNPEDLASSLLDMGIKSMKIWPFDFAKGAVTGLEISNEDLKKYIEPFEKIRKCHGDNIRIKAELHGIWGLEASKKICKALEEFDMCWIEDPIWMDIWKSHPKSNHTPPGDVLYPRFHHTQSGTAFRACCAQPELRGNLRRHRSQRKCRRRSKDQKEHISTIYPHTFVLLHLFS